MLNISKTESLISEKGWSNTYFSSLFNKNKGWVRDWKRGRGLPDMNMLQAIADKLDTTVEYLTDQTDIKNKPATTEGSGHVIEGLDELMKIYESLQPEKRKKLLAIAHLEVDEQKAK